MRAATRSARTTGERLSGRQRPQHPLLISLLFWPFCQTTAARKSCAKEELRRARAYTPDERDAQTLFSCALSQCCSSSVSRAAGSTLRRKSSRARHPSMPSTSTYIISATCRDCDCAAASASSVASAAHLRLYVYDYARVYGAPCALPKDAK